MAKSLLMNHETRPLLSRSWPEGPQNRPYLGPWEALFRPYLGPNTLLFPHVLAMHYSHMGLPGGPRAWALGPGPWAPIWALIWAIWAISTATPIGPGQALARP